MEKNSISWNMTIAETVEMYPQTFPLFRLLGICCINESNQDTTIEELCRSFNVKPDSFLEALRKTI